MRYDDDTRYISRIEQDDRQDRSGGAYRAWWVRLWWRNGKPTVHRSFADSKYGGEMEALNAAIQWRDEQLAEKQKPSAPKKRRGRTANKSA
jgi:hypothetical protein